MSAAGICRASGLRCVCWPVDRVQRVLLSPTSFRVRWPDVELDGTTRTWLVGGGIPRNASCLSCAARTRPGSSSATSNRSTTTDTGIGSWATERRPIKGPIPPHPLPRGVRDQLNPNNDELALNPAGLSNGDWPSIVFFYLSKNCNGHSC
jgi:hypothetical protein